MPQSVLEEVTLPNDAELLRRPLFPLAHDAADGFAGRRKADERMQMVGHQEKQVRPPEVPFLPVLHRFKKRVGPPRTTQAGFGTVHGS